MAKWSSQLTTPYLASMSMQRRYWKILNRHSWIYLVMGNKRGGGVKSKLKSTSNFNGPKRIDMKGENRGPWVQLHRGEPVGDLAEGQPDLQENRVHHAGADQTRFRKLKGKKTSFTPERPFLSRYPSLKWNLKLLILPLKVISLFIIYFWLSSWFW